MRTVAVVITKPVPHAPTQFQSMLIASQVDVFIFEASPQPFHKPVVHPPSATIHTHPHARCLHRPDIVGGGELRPLIGVGDDRGSLASRQRHPPCLHTDRKSV